MSTPRAHVVRGPRGRTATFRLAGVVALAAWLAACGSSSPTAPSSAAADDIIPARVVVLGDSLAVSPSLAESYPAQLQATIAARGLPWTVTNAGIGGDTTSGGLARVQGLLADDVGVLVVALGANDGLRGVDVATVESNLSRIIELAQARSIRVLLCGMETPPTRGWEYTVAFHRIFPRLADRHRVPLVPFLLEGVALVPELNGPDGVHPNAAGARRIAATIWPYLQPLLRQAAIVV